MKKFIKKILVSISVLLSKVTKKNLPSLIYYHDVSELNGKSYDLISISKFESQMNQLIKLGYRTICFSELSTIKYNQRTLDKNVLISFDDGYLSNYELVFPLMKRLGLKFNIFLEVGSIGRKSNYINWDMVVEMYESGIVEFGSHTYNHVDVRFVKDVDLQTEFLKANNNIERVLNINVEDFCFPYGAYDYKSIDIIKNLSLYKRVYTSDGKSIFKDPNCIILGRVGIENEDDETIFTRKLEGSYNLYYSLSRCLRKFFLGGNKENVRPY